MKILFAIYQLDFADHISVAQMSAIAKQLGHTTYFRTIVEGNYIQAVSELKPDVIAYSTNVYGFDEMVAAHKAARKVHKFVSIMGGPHVTFFPDTFSTSGVDYYCIGEGDLAFRDFLERVAEGRGCEDVPNIMNADYKNPVRDLLKNLDELPFADRDLTIANTFLRDAPKKTFYASRGCPFKCSYCAVDIYNNMYQGKGPVVRKHSVQRLIEEIEYVGSRYRMDFVKFGDDLFALKADAWLEEFAEEYPKRVGKPFNCYARIDRLDDKLLGLLQKAGCYSFHLSVDSTSHKVREEVFRRKIKPGVDFVEKLKMVDSYGIKTWVNYMLAAPGSTVQDDLDTIKMSKAGRVTYPAYSTTVPMERTALYDYTVGHGLLDPNDHKSDLNGCSEKSSLECFTEKEKNIRYNVYLLGPIISKFPRPFDSLAIALIKIIPPNRLFKAIRNTYYQYMIENVIFKLKPDEK